jgi:hypothetical protein
MGKTRIGVTGPSPRERIEVSTSKDADQSESELKNEFEHADVWLVGNDGFGL